MASVLAFGALPASSYGSSESKISGKTIIVTFVIALLIGLVIYKSYQAAQKNKVAENCSQGLNMRCLTAVGGTFKDAAITVAPPVMACATQGFASPGCVAHIINGYAQ